MRDRCTNLKARGLGRARELRIAKAMLGFGLPLSQEGIKLLNT